MVELKTMQDVQAKMARINADVARLRIAYGMPQVTMEERAARWQEKQALIAKQLAAARPAPKWKI